MAGRVGSPLQGHSRALPGSSIFEIAVIATTALAAKTIASTAWSKVIVMEAIATVVAACVKPTSGSNSQKPVPEEPSPDHPT